HEALTFNRVLCVFFNTAHNRIKVLYQEQNGFCLWLKRLESDQSVPQPLSRCQVWLAGDTLRDIFVLQVHRRD
ncbi:hypothetical protein CU663_27925, partial [Pseudomonas syringae pv. actinidifoliorum]|nr:hypothetical protein [Pseudomonas syringae pv. actinidifoliorum]